MLVAPKLIELSEKKSDEAGTDVSSAPQPEYATITRLQCHDHGMLYFRHNHGWAAVLIPHSQITDIPFGQSALLIRGA